ncbi:MAG: transcriptional regulator [Gammaproteobacteria bacterium RIFCSPHIGHO2_12_FULL_35_23]|nr:MAG: transcriptional regulator [Gammaproteobacteria bacterium RIFCSPHIGHO2_12_FULL_35_23]
MNYSVKKLAELSGVSIRTLHYYDEIGLLKPAHYGENGYRYYQIEQLLTLQQILFYRELDLSLSEIKLLLNGEDFDKLQALCSHQKLLKQKLNRIQQLINTIDQTINYLRGKTTMETKELFYGFDSNKQACYEQELIASEVATSEDIMISKNKVKHWQSKDWEQYQQRQNELHLAFVVAINNQLAPESTTVQALVAQHYQLIKNFWTPTRETYLGLSRLYYEHPDFKKFFDHYDSRLLEYLTSAMQIFANQSLS